MTDDKKQGEVEKSLHDGMSEEERKRQREKAIAALVDEVHEDFKRRQEERRALERSWQLNLNFLGGNQYCDVNTLGEIEGDGEQYFWQERRVFNHLSSAIDSRCSKLTGIKTRLVVKSASEDEDDRKSAKLASAILSATCEDCDLDGLLSSATMWSESCGTVFYKVTWDGNAGNEIGKTFDGESLREGKVTITVVPAFEIYPATLSEQTLSAQPSIIHARAVPVEDIYSAYGVEVEGRDIDDYGQVPASYSAFGGRAINETLRGVKHGYEVVIERYVRPNREYPDGRLTIVAGKHLLYDGVLPYLNGESGGRTYPFAVQKCIPLAGSFFGVSVTERLIPIQRAYNAVKNRKHEFLNRISMGTIAVEDGSVDADELVEEGLVPGKVIVYRQGGTPPEMLELGGVPEEFGEEERRLEEEFYRISGTTDLTQKANVFASVTSATGLQLLIEQEETKLNVCYEQIRGALKDIGKLTLRLYRQFASGVRLLKFSSGGDTYSVVSFKGSDIMGDDVVLESDSDANMSPARQRAIIYDMVDKGLFTDENGRMSKEVRAKLLKTLGYGTLVDSRDIPELHRQRSEKENEQMKKGETVAVKDYDDHAVHITEHTVFLLTQKLTEEEEKRVCEHINSHKNKLTEVRI